MNVCHGLGIGFFVVSAVSGALDSRPGTRSIGLRVCRPGICSLLGHLVRFLGSLKLRFKDKGGDRLTQKRLCYGLRRCPVQDKVVRCSGLCSVVYGHTDGAVGADVAILCPVKEKALDLALNGRVPNPLF